MAVIFLELEKVMNPTPWELNGFQAKIHNPHLGRWY